jgi:RimJ/RimL family protein N-acetyltransferase
MERTKTKYYPISLDLKIRNLETKDKDLLYKWRNLEKLVLLSLTKKKVKKNEHENWFNSIIYNKNILAFIIEKSLIPIGKIQFKKIGKKKCLIGIYLIGKNIGLGMGPNLIRKSCKLVFKKWKSATIIEAEIRKENKRSFYAFKKAGFENFEDKKKTTNDKINKLVLYRD